MSKVNVSNMSPKEYKEYVKEKTPESNLPANMAKAFVVGGSICVLGQAILNYCKNLGMKDDIATISVKEVDLKLLPNGMNAKVNERIKAEFGD